MILNQTQNVGLPNASSRRGGTTASSSISQLAHTSAPISDPSAKQLILPESTLTSGQRLDSVMCLSQASQSQFQHVPPSNNSTQQYRNLPNVDRPDIPKSGAPRNCDRHAAIPTPPSSSSHSHIAPGPEYDTSQLSATNIRNASGLPISNSMTNSTSATMHSSSDPTPTPAPVPGPGPGPPSTETEIGNGRDSFLRSLRETRHLDQLPQDQLERLVAEVLREEGFDKLVRHLLSVCRIYY